MGLAGAAVGDGKVARAPRGLPVLAAGGDRVGEQGHDPRTDDVALFDPGHAVTPRAGSR